MRFCPEEWTQFLALCPDLPGAHRRLRHPDPNGIRWTRTSAAASNPSVRPQAEAEEEISKAHDTIVAALRLQLVEGSIIGRGLHIQSAEEKDIPKSFWENLTFDFEKNVAEMDGQRFEQVSVRYADSAAASASLKTHVVAWLEARKVQAPADKKEDLRKAAIAHFGPELKHRDFDAAYTEVHGARGRGRPRGATPRK